MGRPEGFGIPVGGAIAGVLEGVDESGRLILMVEGRREAFVAGTLRFADADGTRSS